MYFQIAVEDMEPDHWVAWNLDLLGCYSAARTSTEAIAQATRSISRYFAWISEHDHSIMIPEEPLETEVVETFLSFPSQRDPSYIVNAFFEDDRRPLTCWDVVITQKLLDWSRESLLKIVQGLDEQRLNQPIPGEVRGSIAGILEHVAGAENWYFSQLSLCLERTTLLENLLARLAQVRTNTKEQFWKLIGERQITENYDERWSARKILRRTLWHERDHTQQIEQLLKEG